VYAAATAEQRRVLHRRLAVLVPDLEEHARHLALGAEAPDADVASALERAAERAHARGALPAAVELSEQARRLTPLELEDMSHRRTIQAAGYAWEAGDSDRARELLGDTASPGRGRGEVLYWLGMIEEYEGDRREAVELYRRAGSEMGNDIALRAKIEDGLASALFLMRSDLSAAAGHARAAVSLAEQAGEPGTQIACLSQLGMIDAVTGGHEWREALELGRGLEGRAGPIPVDATTTFALAVVLSWTDELGRSRELFGSLLGMRMNVERRAACRGSSRSSDGSSSSRGVGRRRSDTPRRATRPRFRPARSPSASSRSRCARWCGRRGATSTARAPTPARRSRSPMNAA
jgi:tetratricopeptide (TPR) repeat protein